MSSNDEVPSCQNLGRNLPEEPVTPSAPLYDTTLCVENLHGITKNVDKEEAVPLRASVPSPYDDAKKRLRIEAEIKKAQLRKEQLIRERQIMEEEFKAKERLIDAEIEFVLTSLDSAEEGPSNSNTPNGVQLVNKAVNLNAHNQVLGSQPGQTNGKRIERPLETPKPIGLEYLGVLDYLSIRQLVSRSLDESYEVVAPGNVVILRANLSFDVANAVLMGQRTCLQVNIFDNEVNELINFRSTLSGPMELLVNRQLACLIRSCPTWIKPMLMIHDVDGRPLLKVKGPGMGNNRNVFLVQTIHKVNIGSIDKTPVRLGPDYMADNHTAVRFPLDLDVRCKAAIIASSFLIASKIVVKFRNQKLRHAVLRETPAYM